MSKNITLAAVIPTYNASTTIGRVISATAPFVDLVIVVDDGSTDDSAAIVERAATEKVRLVRHTVNCGVGAAVLTGYRTALELGADVIVKLDADDQMDPSFIPELVRPILRGEADYVKGNRFLHLTQLRQMPAVRLIGNLGLSLLVKIASGYWSIFDPTNGFTAIHRQLLPMLLNGDVDHGFFFEISMLTELGLHRAAVRDVYIPARYPNTGSHLSELRALLTFPAKLFKRAARRFWVQYVVRDFGLVPLFAAAGTSLILAGSGYGAYHWVHAASANMVTPPGTVMLAALPILLGFLLVLQALLLDVMNEPRNPVHREAPYGAV